MSQLRSVLDQLAVLDPDQFSIEQVAEEIEEAVIGIQVLEVFTAIWTKNLADRRAMKCWVIRLRPPI